MSLRPPALINLGQRTVLCLPNLLYIGHATCNQSISGHMVDFAHGAAVRDRNIVGINTFDEDMQTLVLVHEIGHIFGAPDHYDDEANGYADRNYTTEEANTKFGTSSFSQLCMYGERKLDVVD